MPFEREIDAYLPKNKNKYQHIIYIFILFYYTHIF